MKKFPYFLILLFLVFSCKKTEEERGNKEEVISEISPPVHRKVNATDIVLPEGYKTEALVEGLPYPVDITFDEDGNSYMAEAGGHTYDTKPSCPREVNFLMGASNKKLTFSLIRLFPRSGKKILSNH